MRHSLERVVERNRIHDILMAFKRQQFVAGGCAPHFARAIVGAGDEPARSDVKHIRTSIKELEHRPATPHALVARLVERAVGQRQDMSPQDFVQEEVIAVVGLQLLNKLVDQATKLWLPPFRYERLLEHNLVH